MALNFRDHETSDNNLDIVRQHSPDCHPPAAFNCLHCSCFFFCDLCILLPLHHSARLSASFCTPECAIHNSQTLTSFCHRLVQLQRGRMLSRICLPPEYGVCFATALVTRCRASPPWETKTSLCLRFNLFIIHFSDHPASFIIISRAALRPGENTS